MRSVKDIWPKALLAAASVALLAVGSWWLDEQQSLAQFRRTPLDILPRGEGYTPVARWPEENAPAKWSRPSTRSPEREWIYDVFTPPEIYYDPLRGAFTLARQEAIALELDDSEIELLAVRQEPFRLQLLGGIGGDDGYVGIFSSPFLPGTLLLREGGSVPELGVELKSVEARKFSSGGENGELVVEPAVVALILDQISGDEVTLDSRTPKFTGAPTAMLRVGYESSPREVKRGDVIEVGTLRYVVGELQLEPAQIRLSRLDAGNATGEVRVLTRRGEQEHLNAPVSPVPQRSPDGGQQITSTHQSP